MDIVTIRYTGAVLSIYWQFLAVFGSFWQFSAEKKPPQCCGKNVQKMFKMFPWATLPPPTSRLWGEQRIVFDAFFYYTFEEVRKDIFYHICSDFESPSLRRNRGNISDVKFPLWIKYKIHCPHMSCLVMLGNERKDLWCHIMTSLL